MKKLLLIWGTGNAAQIFSNEYKTKYAQYIDIVAYIDSNPTQQKKLFLQKKVYAPENILLLKWDIILLCTMRQECEEEMKKYLLRIGVDGSKIATFLNYGGFGVLRNTLIEKYSHSHDKEIQSMVQYMKLHEPGVFNMDMDRKNEKYQLHWDTPDDDPYIIIEGKRLYYPKEYVNNYGCPYVSDVYLEQSTDSPHLYVPKNKEINKGVVMVDAGAREGNFSLQYIDVCSKLFVVECDQMWCRVLAKTFKPYKNKVQIVNAFLDEKDSDNACRIDSFVDGQIDILKMDIEGMEYKALKGAKKCLTESKAFCSICSYHNSEDEKKIKSIMEELGYKTWTSKGYMLFLWDHNFYNSLDVRRGIVYAEK